MIIRDHVVDHDDASIGFAQGLDLGNRGFGLGPRRHQSGTIEHSPAVILRMRDFDPPRAELDGKLDHFAGVRDIGAMNDGVHGQGQADPRDPARNGLLAREATLVAGDFVGGLRFGILDRKLYMVEARRREVVDALLRKADSRGDQIGVEADLCAMGDDLDQIAPRGGFAAGKMGMENA